MYAFYIEGEQIKKFMNCLFRTDMFDKFLVRGTEISTFTDFTVSGITNKNYYDAPPEQGYCFWKELKPIIFNIIKGDKTPSHMKIVLSITKEEAEKVHPNCAAAFLNIIYENNVVTFVSGCSQKSFSPDKSHEDSWNSIIKDFFSKTDLTINTIE